MELSVTFHTFHIRLNPICAREWDSRRALSDRELEKFVRKIHPTNSEGKLHDRTS